MMGSRASASVVVIDRVMVVWDDFCRHVEVLLLVLGAIVRVIA